MVLFTRLPTKPRLALSAFFSGTLFVNSSFVNSSFAYSLFAYSIFSLALLPLALMSSPALALELPKASRDDYRIRYAAFNPANVIQLDAVIGVATHIVLEEDETYVYHVFGDSAAYAFTYKDNHLFFKPIAQQADTNLLVVTNRRSYAFRLTYSNKPDARALYKLVIRYPDSDAKQAQAAREQSAIRSAFAQSGTPINWRGYTRSGDATLAPVHAWDDGAQTWLQFAQQADIPAAYRVTPDGQEVITNFHMADDRTMVLHRTSAQWYLRLGNQVLAIYNEDYGKNEAPSASGTVSPNVVRIVNGVEPQSLPPANPIKEMP